MESFDDELPDGAWQAMLEGAVVQFNEDQDTNFDPNDMFSMYCERKSINRV